MISVYNIVIWSNFLTLIVNHVHKQLKVLFNIYTSFKKKKKANGISMSENKIIKALNIEFWIVYTTTVKICDHLTENLSSC